MKIIIDYDENSDNIRIYNSKEEYDADPESWAGFERTHKWGTYQLRHKRAPGGFPCLMFSGGISCNPDGPDEIDNMFIYSFTIAE